MQTQSDKIPLTSIVAQGLTEEARCFILYELTKRIWNRDSIGSGPESIYLTKDNRIFISMSRDLENINLAYFPPEMARSSSDAESAPDTNSAWFLLGMIAYYLYCGVDFYTAKNVQAIYFMKRCEEENKEFVISEEDAERIPFGAAVSHMTAMNPHHRRDGAAKFLGYLMEKVPCTAELSFLCDGQVIGSRQLRFSGREIENLREVIPDGLIAAHGGFYRLKNPSPPIPYRPGQCRIEVPVERVTDTPTERRGDNAPRYLLCVDYACITGLQEDMDNPEEILTLSDTNAFRRLANLKRKHLKLGRDGNRYLFLFLFLPDGECRGFLRFRAPDEDADAEYTAELTWTPALNQIQAEWFLSNGRSINAREQLILDKDLREEDFDDWMV